MINGHGEPGASPLSAMQQAIVPIAALAARGDMSQLASALNQGLDAGLTINVIKEVLVQLYAYAGFPRSLNALGQFMKVVEERKGRSIVDAAGAEPGKPIPQADALLAAGTTNQTKLSGAPVQGPLFDFAPQAALYLRTHLFGDIFERDNLAWANRELATLAMLAALPGAEPQLQAHVRMSINAGLSHEQVQVIAEVLAAHVGEEESARARAAVHVVLNA